MDACQEVSAQQGHEQGFAKVPGSVCPRCNGRKMNSQYGEVQEKPGLCFHKSVLHRVGCRHKYKKSRQMCMGSAFPQHHKKSCSLPVAAAHSQLPAMGLYDLLGEAQPYAAAFFLGGVKGDEDLVHRVRVNTRAIICHGNAY